MYKVILNLYKFFLKYKEGLNWHPQEKLPTFKNPNLISIKSCMPNPDRSLGHIKCFSLSSHKPFKNPSNYMRYNCPNICSLSKKIDNKLKIRTSYQHSCIREHTKLYKNLENMILSNTYWKVQLAYTKVHIHSSSEPSSEHYWDEMALNSKVMLWFFQSIWEL